MSPRTQGIIGIVLVLGMGAILWFGILGPRFSQAADLQERAASVDASNTALTARVGRLRTLADQAPAVAARAEALFRTMPQQADLPVVLNDITAAARDSGISPDGILAISPAAPVPLTAATPAGANSVTATAAESIGVKIATLPMTITVEGDPAVLDAFVGRLQNLQRAFVITGTQYATGPTVPGKPATTSLTVTGTMFVLASQLPDLVAEVTRSLPAGR